MHQRNENRQADVRLFLLSFQLCFACTQSYTWRTMREARADQSGDMVQNYG